MKKHFMFLLVLSFVISGCATITQGTKDALVVNSNPEEAQVQLSNGQSCVSTPCVFSIPRKDSFTVTISKAGCKSRTVNVTSKMATAGGTALAGNVLVGGLIGLGVDAATGASKELVPNPVEVNLSC